ncbi:hypothetical protein FIBSPDRAFT_369414 [Athelia psychrophila]|uniref:Uncharacterized protein n=1 Tax=Athelia psychrophila TaxID=1759441 RepID=A0A166PAA0_9AGAM|nr:hypothetical protein FIBSPDRAFT_369414 [Fibularhizoctonia sp. CBS 109695]
MTQSGLGPGPNPFLLNAQPVSAFTGHNVTRRSTRRPQGCSLVLTGWSRTSKNRVQWIHMKIFDAPQRVINKHEATRLHQCTTSLSRQTGLRNSFLVLLRATCFAEKFCTARFRTSPVMFRLKASAARCSTASIFCHSRNTIGGNKLLANVYVGGTCDSGICTAMPLTVSFPRNLQPLHACCPPD